MRGKDSRLNKDFILESIGQGNKLNGQIVIFEKYLGIPNVFSLIKDDVTFTNPLREDTFPTCTFKLYTTREGGHKLWFRDWADVQGYDCFDLVQKMANCGFMECLELIAHHFSLLSAEPSLEMKYVLTPTQIKQLTIKKMQEINIQIKQDGWTTKHIDFWKQYGLGSEDVTYDTIPVKSYWINGDKHVVPKNLGFYYIIEKDGAKLYFPLADKGRKELKFIHNRADVVQGHDQLKYDKNTLIITSSNKDVKVLRKLVRMYPELDFEVVAPMSETTPIKKERIEFYKSKYSMLVTYYNNDKEGERCTEAHGELYQCVGFCNPENWGKDPSDVVKNNIEPGYKKLKELIEYNLNKFKPPF
jgi:hypothetical protein